MANLGISSNVFGYKNALLSGRKLPKAGNEDEKAAPTITKISVNLLPQEILLQKGQRSKLLLINKISIFTLVVLVFFTSATLALRLIQGSALQKSQQSLVYAQDRVTSLKDKEQQIFLLKDRLDSIQSLSDLDVKRREIFNLVVFLTPPDIHILEISVDKDGNMNISLVSPSLSSIGTLVSNLGNQEKNSNLISRVELQGLSIGKDFVYRFSLRIVPKQ